MHLSIQGNVLAGSALNDLESFTSFRTQLKESGPLSPPNAQDLELVGSNVDLLAIR